MKKSRLIGVLVLTLLSVFQLTCAHSAPGDEHWDNRFARPGVSNFVYALTARDGKLYAGGIFVQPTGVTNNQVDVWDGSKWSALPPLEGGFIVAFELIFYNNDLYVGGTFTGAGGVPARGLARWDGAAWHDVGGFRGLVASMAVYNGNLIVAGSFTNQGSVVVTNIAAWNGGSWLPMGAGLGFYDSTANTGASAVTVYEGQLYAGGSFTNSGAAQVRGLAMWDGANWVEVGGGIAGGINALAADNTALYAAGKFTSAGTTAAANIVAWNGSTWSTLGPGLGSDVYGVAVNNGVVYAGGAFTNAGAVAVRRFAAWNGSAWSAFGSGANDVVETIIADGNDIYLGGGFTQIDDLVMNHVGKWNASTGLSGLGDGGAFGSVFVNAIGAGGSNVYAGGLFTGAGTTRASRIARWDGSHWNAMGTGLKGINEGSGTDVRAIAVRDADAYIGGVFTNAGGVTANNIARWNGSSWSALGLGVNSNVLASAFDYRGVLCVGGRFTTAGPIAANRIAFWDGVNWSALGSGLDNSCLCLVTNGSDLYAGGSFLNAGGALVNRIAKWNGTSWSALGGGMGSGNVSALAFFNNELYAGGSFTTAGGQSISAIAKWNGSTSWSALGSGLTNYFNGALSVLSAASSGNDLYLGGAFTLAGGKLSVSFAHWNDQINFDILPELRLSNPQLVAGGFQFRVNALSIPSYVIERTTNLSNWTPVKTNSTTPYDFVEPAGSPSRFYRARQGQ